MSGSGNATFRLRWGQIEIKRFSKAVCLAWLFTFPDTALGESLLCHHRSTCSKDITDASTVRACSLLQGNSRRGTWAADGEEVEAIGAAGASGSHTHSGVDGRHSITSIPQSIAVWVNSMFSSAVDANWTAGTAPQSLFASGRKNITKFIQTAANHSQPLTDYNDGSDKVVVDRDAWDGYQQRAGDTAFQNLLPLHLHLQGISLDTLMERVAENHSVLLRYIDNRGAKSSLATKPSVIKGDSIAQLIEILRLQFAKVCHLPVSKFLMSSVHGRFLRPQRSDFFEQNSSDGVLLQGLQSQPETQGGIDLVSVVVEPDEHIAEEVVVRFFVLDSNSLVQKVIDKLREELGDKNSELMRGELSNLLQRASITVGYENDYMLTAANHVRGVEGLFVPVIVSAVFMMLLMWLSAI